MKFNTLKYTLLFCVASVFASCGNSITQVWDYYIKNGVEVHKQDAITITKSELLYRKSEKVSKAQLEFVAFKQDDAKYLVIGSHKVAKNFYIHDTLYAFDVVSLYNKVRGDDFIRQMGDLSIYFTHIPYENIQKYLENETMLLDTFSVNRPTKSETVYIDYQLSPTVYISLPKTGGAKRPSDMVLWVGHRKHEMSYSTFKKILNEVKEFN